MIQQLDFSILDWILANLRCDFLDYLMPLVTLYAEHGILLIGIGVVLLIFRSHRVCGAAVLSGLTGGLLIGNLFLKNLIARARPCWINTDVSMLVSVPTDYSFPSGHTLHCFIVATVLMYYDKRLGVPALVMAVLVGFSRLYLYVHFPTDVIAGAAIGIGIGILTVIIFKQIRNRRKGRISLEAV